MWRSAKRATGHYGFSNPPKGSEAYVALKKRYDEYVLQYERAVKVKKEIVEHPEGAKEECKDPAVESDAQSGSSGDVIARRSAPGSKEERGLCRKRVEEELECFAGRRKRRKLLAKTNPIGTGYPADESVIQSAGGGEDLADPSNERDVKSAGGEGLGIILTASYDQEAVTHGASVDG